MHRSVEGRTNVTFLCFSVFLVVCLSQSQGLFSSHLRVLTDENVLPSRYTGCSETTATTMVGWVSLLGSSQPESVCVL
jgi:hypothetical protein